MRLNVMNGPGGVVSQGEALDSLNALSGADLMARASHVNRLGRRAFREGKPCDPGIPLRMFSKSGREIGIHLMESWMNGWTDESLMRLRVDGCQE